MEVINDSRKSQDTGTKGQIYNVALELFRTHGYHNVTINQICKECEITKRTFYYHWDSKEAIVMQIVDETGIKAEQILETMSSGKPTAEILYDIFDKFSKRDLELGPQLIKQLFIIRQTNPDTENFPYTALLYNTVRNLITNAVEKNEIFCATTPEDLCFALFHTLRSIAYTWAENDGKTDLEADSRKVLNAIIIPKK